MMRKIKFYFYLYICVCILFFASLFLSLAALYKTVESLKSFNADAARRWEFAGHNFYSFSRFLRIPVLPVLYITATKKSVDEVIWIEERGFKISRSGVAVIDNVNEISRLITKTDRSKSDMEKLNSLGKRSAKELETVLYTLSVLQKKAQKPRVFAHSPDRANKK